MYERGIFERQNDLLKVAETYCLSHTDCELILADIYGSRASVDSETNKFEDCYRNFEKQYMYLSQAIAKGLSPSPSIREVFALGGMGNGCLALHRYKEAEEYYKQCFEVWKDVPGDKRIYVRVELRDSDPPLICLDRESRRLPMAARKAG
jgi:hypothetical protein